MRLFISFLKYLGLSILFILLTFCEKKENVSKEDPEIPTVIISSPENGSLISQDSIVTIKVDVAGESDYKILMVVFYIDDENVAHDESAPFIYEWTTNNVKLGQHNIKIVANDDNGNQYEDEITVEVVSPNFSVNIQGTLRDKSSNGVLANIPISFDGQSIISDQDGSFAATKKINAGNYSLKIDATNNFMSTLYGFDVDADMDKTVDIYLYPKHSSVTPKSNFVKGVSLFDAGPWMDQDLYPDEFNATFDRLELINSNLVTVFDPIFVTAVGNDSVKMSSSANSQWPWNMLTTDQYSTLVTSAKSKGLDFMYWFGVWPNEEVQIDGKSFNSTVFSGTTLTDAFWDDWFSEYWRELKPYAISAESNSVPYFSLGHGLNYATSPYQFSNENLYINQWTALIDSIKSYYNGDIIYFASENPFDAYDYGGGYKSKYSEADGFTNEFKSLFDVFGIVVSNVTSKVNPTITDVKTGMTTLLNKYSSFGKPIIVWLWGSSVDGAANTYGHLEPVLDVNRSADNFSVDFYEQADIYEGVFQALNETSVDIRGVISHGYMYLDKFSEYEPRNMETAFDKSASIRNKPAEGIVEYWFENW
jgi:hypothetical protein